MTYVELKTAEEVGGDWLWPGLFAPQLGAGEEGEGGWGAKGAPYLTSMLANHIHLSLCERRHLVRGEREPVQSMSRVALCIDYANGTKVDVR